MLTGTLECGCGCDGTSPGCGLGDSDPSQLPYAAPSKANVIVAALGFGALAMGLAALLWPAKSPRRPRARYTGRVARPMEGTRTKRLPRETMRQIVWERRR